MVKELGEERVEMKKRNWATVRVCGETPQTTRQRRVLPFLYCIVPYRLRDYHGAVTRQQAGVGPGI